MASAPATPFARIGTRGSPLALVQAEEVRRRLVAAHGVPADEIEIVVISTGGDRIQEATIDVVG